MIRHNLHIHRNIHNHRDLHDNLYSHSLDRLPLDLHPQTIQGWNPSTYPTKTGDAYVHRYLLNNQTDLDPEVYHLLQQLPIHHRQYHETQHDDHYRPTQNHYRFPNATETNHINLQQTKLPLHPGNDRTTPLSKTMLSTFPFPRLIHRQQTSYFLSTRTVTTLARRLNTKNSWFSSTTHCKWSFYPRTAHQ